MYHVSGQGVDKCMMNVAYYDTHIYLDKNNTLKCPVDHDKKKW